MRTDGLSLLGLAAKRVTRDPSVIIHPLTYGILQLVLDFVGPGNYLFVSVVNKAWNDAYKSVQSVAIPRVCNSAYEKPESITCAPSMTATSAVFASPARLLLAVAANFQLDTYWSRPWISVAASTADVPTLSVANEHGMHWSDLVLRALAKSGRLTELMWVHTVQQRSLPRDIIDDAAEGDSESMLAWLIGRGCEVTLVTTVRAATAGKLPALKYLQQQKSCCSRDTFIAAVRNGLQCCSGCIRTALTGNHGWGTSQAIQQATTTCRCCSGSRSRGRGRASAARKGHTAACKYIHAQGGEWGYEACGGAAEANNLELLQWLHDSECLWDCAEVCGHAARNGSAEMMHYIYEQGAADELEPEEETELLTFAGHYGHLLVAVFLREQGAEWPDELR
jgi:hypothetical protein